MWLLAAGSPPTKYGNTIEFISLDILQHLLRREGCAADLAANDAYAVGVTLFELATGELPLTVHCKRPNGKAGMIKRETRFLEQVLSECCTLLCAQAHRPAPRTRPLRVTGSRISSRRRHS